jgi:hypothetical protein
MTTRSRKPRLRRKNLIPGQHKIDRAKRLLGAATETEAITQALDAARFPSPRPRSIFRLE